MMINREVVVRRHSVEVTEPDPALPLTVGNGDFAYTADITGMQTYPAFHDQTAGYRAGRLADRAPVSRIDGHDGQVHLGGHGDQL